jgi:hypothetical protein
LPLAGTCGEEYKMIRKNKKFIDPRYFMDEKLAEVTNMNQKDLPQFNEWLDYILASLRQRKNIEIDEDTLQESYGGQLYSIWWEARAAGDPIGKADQIAAEYAGE